MRRSRRNFGDSRAPSQLEAPGLTQLSLSADGGSRITKKNLTSAYHQGLPGPAPARKPKKASFFAPRKGPPPAPRQQSPAAATGAPAAATGAPAAAGESLSAPPIVQSYNLSKIDLPMRMRDDGTGGSKAKERAVLSYPSVHKIRWAVTTETFRPADGLHVPGDVRGLPRRSGLKGGRGGRPAPDTRLLCAQTGISHELFGEERVGAPEKSLSGGGATKTSLGLTSDKTAMRTSPTTDEAASSTPTPSIPGALPMPRTEPVTPALPMPPQQPVPPAATQVSAPPLLTETSSSVHGSAKNQEKSSVATPPPSESTGVGVFLTSGVGGKGGAVVAIGEKHGSNETGGAGVEAKGGAGVEAKGGAGVEAKGGAGMEAKGGAGVEAKGGAGMEADAGARVGAGARAGVGDGRAYKHQADGTRLDNGEGSSTGATPVTSSMRLCDYIAVTRRVAEGSQQEASSTLSPQLSEEEEENRDEEDGRELLQSMMMNSGPGNAADPGPEDDADDGPEDDGMDLCSEEGPGDGIAIERTYPVGAQLSYSAEPAEPSYLAYCTQEKDAEEDENIDGKGMAPVVDKFLADFERSMQAPPVDPPVAVPSTAAMDVGNDSMPSSLLSTTAAGEVDEGGGGDAPAIPAPPPPPVAQVAWSAPLKISHRVNTNNAPVEETLSQRTAWVQPRRIGGSSSGGVAAASSCAATPLPPGEEAKPRAENVAAQSLSGAHAMPAPADPSILPNVTSEKVAWRPPSRLGARTATKGTRPTDCPDAQLEGRGGGGVSSDELQRPSDAVAVFGERVAELLSQSAARSSADGDAVLEKPLAPRKLPGQLVPPPPSRTQGLAPHSSSGSSPQPCDEKEEVGEAGQALPPSGFTKDSPDELDETPNGVVDDLVARKTKCVASTSGGVDATATTKKLADETTFGDRQEGNGHSQSNGKAHDGRRAVANDKPALEATPREFNRSRASSSPTRNRSRSDSPRQSNRGSSSSSGATDRRRHGGHDRPRSRDSPRRRSRDRSSSSSGRQRRRYDGHYDDNDRWRSRDDGYRHRRYDESGRSGSRGSSDSSSRSRREEQNRWYHRDGFGRECWDRNVGYNTTRKGGFDSGLRSPREDGHSQDTKRPRRNRSSSPQR